MHREHLAVMAAALTVVCVLPYLRDIRRGVTRPQRASWLVFAALAAVAAVSQSLEGADAGALLAAGAAVAFGAVSVASIRRGVGGFARPDRIALAVAVVGTALSIATAQPVTAVMAVVVAEVGAVALTVRKALVDPDSETRATWLIDGVAGAMGIAAVRDVSFVTLLYPVHHTLANATVVAAITIGCRAQRRNRWAPA